MLFTFPSRYWFTIGLTGVFSLAGWSRRIRAGFLVSRLTQDSAKSNFASLTGLSPSMVKLSSFFCSQHWYYNAVLLPQLCRNRTGLGSSPVARHYWGNHCLFSLPQGTKMFQFPWFASGLSPDDSPSDCRVVPFGNPRVKGYLHLTEAYRSLSRPSSPP